VNRSIFVLFALVASLAQGVRAGAPFAFDKTPGKLPKEVIPKAYRIAITPDIDKATFAGSVSIDLEVRKTTKRLVLNARDLQISDAKLKVGGETIALTPQFDEKQQTVAFDLQKEIPAGKATLEMNHTGKIGNTSDGLFITRFQTKDGERRALCTQFEATDARRMFPCWDEPVFRATFQLTATVPAKWLAVSNMPTAKEAINGSTKTLEFAVSP